jgi:cobalt-zinc-cadmium efflux system membrane fusion protein
LWHAALGGVLATLLTGCSAGAHASSDDGAPSTAAVDHEEDGGRLHVDHPDRFPIVAATSHPSAPTLTVTGVVSPDVSRAVPVVSLASGRVVDVRVRLGDRVKAGQLLLRIHSADASSAMADYKKAQADAALARAQLERAQALFDRGAIARKDLEVAVDTSAKAAVDAANSLERLRVLGVNPNGDEGSIVDITAPASGVITEQNIANAAGVKTLDNSPNLFTISDLSRVWVVCDVFQNDLPGIQVGDQADVRLAAYADKELHGRIDDIGAVLDPALRTAKVRVEVANPGLLRVGMFVTATIHGRHADTRTVVPASAVLHLHDRDWVYVPDTDGAFERREVSAGGELPGGLQELMSGLAPGERIVANALVFQNTVEQ